MILGGYGADTINAGAGIDRYVYHDTLDSFVSTTDVDAAGFDKVTVEAGDRFEFSTYFQLGLMEYVRTYDAINVDTSSPTSGSGLLNSLNDAFDQSAGHAGLIAYIDRTFLVIDRDSDDLITNKDQVIELIGSVSGITIEYLGEVEIM